MYNSLSFKKKFGLGIMVFLLFFSAFSFAKDDCEDFGADFSWGLFKDFLSVEDLTIARNHLRSFCCLEKPTLSVLSGKCNNLVLGPESPYWYDHLVDVGLRKLDAESLYPSMVPDTDGKGWRDVIKNVGKPNSPGNFKESYVKYWIQSGPYLYSLYGDDYEKFKTDWELNPLTSSFNLHDKYINYCFIAMMMYYQVPNHIDIVADGYYGKCLAMVKSRIRQETSLAMMLSQYHAANLLVEGLSSYTKQFVQDRLMKLVDKIVAISSLFNTFAKQAPLSNSCQK